MLSNSCKWRQKNISILFFVICQTPLKERGISVFRAKNLIYISVGTSVKGSRIHILSLCRLFDLFFWCGFIDLLIWGYGGALFAFPQSELIPEVFLNACSGTIKQFRISWRISNMISHFWPWTGSTPCPADPSFPSCVSLTLFLSLQQELTGYWSDVCALVFIFLSLSLF